MLINFDYDGVIVDSFDALLDIAKRAQVSVGSGRSPAADDFRTIENLAFDDLGRLIGLAEAEVANFSRRIFALQKEHWDVELFPGIVPVFEDLASKHSLVVITSSQSDAVAASLQRFGLGSVISEVLGGELGISKAERIMLAENKYSFSSDDTYMVGDAISDIREGRRAGVKTIAVTWGFQDQGILEKEMPDFVANVPSDLLGIINE